MNREIYLDNSATTKVSDSVKNAMMAALDCYGNPSSLYRKGIDAEQMIEQARERVAAGLGCRSDEIYFTSGGTESNNAALQGAAFARARRGKRIVISAVEHASVLQTAVFLESQGFEVLRLIPGKDGCVAPETVADAINSDTILVSLMHMNNETGAVMPVERLRNIVSAAGAPALIHVDAVQSFMKTDEKLCAFADLVSVSAHKIYGPKGTGALYVRKGVTLRPLFYGGKQERQLRPGTENTAGICGLGQASADLQGKVKENAAYVRELKQRILTGLSGFGEIDPVLPKHSSPFVLNFSVPGVRSETMLHFLESRGVYVSSGSACKKGERSHVLTAMGLPAALIESAVRVSFGIHNTLQDCDDFLEALEQGIRRLKR